MSAVERVYRSASPVLSLGIAVLASISICSSSRVFSQGLQPDEELIRTETIRLLPAPQPMEYFFYFRDEQRGYIVYLPPTTAIKYFSAEIARLLPLDAHTDIFQVYANEASLEHFRSARGQWQIRFYVSQALEAGDVAVWWSDDGFLDEVIVEHYTDRCCSMGRIFKSKTGAVLFRIQDTIIG